VKNRSRLTGASSTSWLPKARIPVPASNIMRCPPHRTSMQVVLPPYLIVSGPGAGMLPRTPQNRTVKSVDDGGVKGRAVRYNFRTWTLIWRGVVAESRKIPDGNETRTTLACWYDRHVLTGATDHG
jgi:hypothetical protein